MGKNGVLILMVKYANKKGRKQLEICIGIRVVTAFSEKQYSRLHVLFRYLLIPTILRPVSTMIEVRRIVLDDSGFLGLRIHGPVENTPTSVKKIF